jgi:hypothetical protein
VLRIVKDVEWAFLTCFKHLCVKTGGKQKKTKKKKSACWPRMEFMTAKYRNRIKDLSEK